MFFDGQLEAEVLLARVGAQWARDGNSGNISSSGRRSGGGGFGGRGGGFGGGRGGGPGGAGMGSPPGGGADDTVPRVPIRASNEPAVQLRLRLANHGSAPVDVEVVDFNSALGNFVVQPSKITLPPGAPVEAEPMISRLGVTAEEIPLTVKLHISDRTEQQVLTLRVVKETAPGSNPPAPPSGAPADGR